MDTNNLLKYLWDTIEYSFAVLCFLFCWWLDWRYNLGDYCTGKISFITLYQDDLQANLSLTSWKELISGQSSIEKTVLCLLVVRVSIRSTWTHFFNFIFYCMCMGFWPACISVHMCLAPMETKRDLECW